MSALNRRDLLRLTLAGAAGLALPGRAPAAPVEPRPEPDWTRLHAEEPHLVGVRPHRSSGVRLELGEPLSTGEKQTFTVHNYGHSGAGITLSLGCAEEAATLVHEARRHARDGSSVAILGTGVIGLTTAAAILRSQPGVKLTIYASNLALQSTTSWVAGGQFEPAGLRRIYAEPQAKERLAGWLRSSKAQIQASQPQWDRLGFAMRDNFTLDHPNGGFDEATPPDVVAPFVRETLPFPRLAIPGRRYRTWLLNPRMWLPVLVGELRASGVRFVERHFDTPADVAALEEHVVVNCTGFGAKALFGDDDLTPMRGHLVRLQRPSEKHDYFFSGGCQNKVIAYVFCRQDDIVLGGTFVPNDARTQIEAEDTPVFAGLLENGRRLFAGAPKTCAWWPQK